MAPPRRTTPADNLERLVKVETLLEQVLERQSEQHEENRRAAAVAAQETREHRHATANAMSDIRGRVGDLKSGQERHAQQIADILAVSQVARQEREGLDKRLKTIETIVTGVKSQWKTLAAVMGAVGLFAGFATACAKVLALATSWFKG